MDTQLLIDIIIGLVAFIGGTYMRRMDKAISWLRKSQQTLVENHNQLQVLVAGNYIKRDEFDKSMERMHDKLDDILKQIGVK